MVEPLRKLNMTKAKDLVKSIVKKPEPNDVKPSFGTNPRDPWSATGAGGGIGLPESITSGRAELLKKFYKSRGYNINYVDKNHRVAQSKMGDYEKWKRDHGIYEDEIQEDLTTKITHPEIRSTVANSPTLKRKSQLDAANARYEIPTPSGTMRHSKEEVVNELSDTTVASYKSAAEKDVKELKPHTKGEYGGIAKRMLSRREKGLERVKMREDNINDPKSACQGPFDGATTTDDLAPKKSKAAKMVKEIYAKHRIKEDMYDHEKDDKGPGTYGKPPKIDKKTEINSDDEKGVNARMVLKGGTTLTGEKRDTIEIDPMMKNRNKSPDYMSQDPKKQQQKPKEQ